MKKKLLASLFTIAFILFFILAFSTVYSVTIKPTLNSTVSEKGNISQALTATSRILPNVSKTIKLTQTTSVKGKTPLPTQKPTEPDVNVSYMGSIMSAVYNEFPDFNITFADFEVTNPGKSPVKITIESEIPGYSELAVTTAIVPANTTVVFGQTPLLVMSKIPATLKTVSFHYRVTADGKNVIDEQTPLLKLFAKDTMVWSVIDGDKKVSQSQFIAAWVTPHIQGIQDLLRIAAEYSPDHSITGYMCSDCITEEEWRNSSNNQVKAIYDALKNEYKITYISSTIAFGPGSNAYQRVHLPEQTLMDSSANCIDGTVLFASAIEAMGMNPLIVIIPGHAFVGWKISPNSEEMEFLETTMIDTNSFEDALQRGAKEYQGEIDNGNFETNMSEIIDISELRKVGITPME